MRTEARNRLTMTRDLVSARREAARADHYAWVWVSPLDDGRFRISTVEVARGIVDNDVCFFEDDIERVHVATASDLDEVDELVRALGVDPDTLDVPWRNGFPL